MLQGKKRLLFFLFLTFSISSVGQTPMIDSLIHPGACRQIVEKLAADSFFGRLTTTAHCEEAAQYIANQFNKAGCVPGAGNGNWFMQFPVLMNGESKQAYNVIGILPGKSKPDEWIIFSAHYDHIGTKNTNPYPYMPEKGLPERNDTIYNGANDNASGTSALILLARYFAKAANNERTLVFIGFSGEELGLWGSAHASRLMKQDSIVAVINMDMLGVPISKKKRNPFLTGARYSNLQKILNNRLFEYSPKEFGKNYFTIDPFLPENLFQRSDNYGFAQKGVPAHTVIATHPRNMYYHSLNDEPGTLDYDLLAKIIRAIAIGASGLIAGTDTPTRINDLRFTQEQIPVGDFIP